MPIEDYSGRTFVAFTDISGFKKMMRREREARRTLKRFYSTGFEALANQEPRGLHRVDGFFVSDCGVLFVRGDQQGSECLRSLLVVLEKINRRCLEHSFMLTTSVAYGEFQYRNLREFRGIVKTPIYGDAYLDAFLDNEHREPRIQPGQCRIMGEAQGYCERESADRYFSRLRQHQNHIYFYWMVSDPEKIDDFGREYVEAIEMRYRAMLTALSRYHSPTPGMANTPL